MGSLSSEDPMLPMSMKPDRRSRPAPAGAASLTIPRARAGNRQNDFSTSLAVQ